MFRGSIRGGLRRETVSLFYLIYPYLRCGLSFVYERTKGVGIGRDSRGGRD